MPGAEWQLRLTVVVGATLRLELATANTANGDATPRADFVIEEALHTYLRVGDIATARLAGLEGCDYLDQLDGRTRRQQDYSLGFCGETDRIYTGTRAACVIEDAQLKRRIRIAKTGSASTVVWSPWRDKAARLGDLGQAEGWRQMLCVETANVRGDAVCIAAGSEHTMAVEISVASI
jgi:D-hexose-6-phosphate mutarotase